MKYSDHNVCYNGLLAWQSRAPSLSYFDNSTVRVVCRAPYHDFLIGVNVYNATIILMSGRHCCTATIEHHSFIHTIAIMYSHLVMGAGFVRYLSRLTSERLLKLDRHWVRNSGILRIYMMKDYFVDMGVYSNSFHIHCKLISTTRSVNFN